jgi:hypothetical protein
LLPAVIGFPSTASRQVDDENCSCEYDWLGSAYFVDRVKNSGGIFPLKTQSDFSFSLGVNEIGYLLMAGGFEVPRSEALPLLQDGLFCEHKLFIMAS